VFAQDSAVIVTANNSLPNKYIKAIDAKSDKLSNTLDAKTTKYLRRFQKQENRLLRKISNKVDSSTSQRLFTDAEKQYQQLSERIRGARKLTHYIPRLDTMITSLQFLDKHRELFSQSKDLQGKLATSMGKINEFKSELQKAEDLKQFLKERRAYLKQQLEQAGLSNQLKKLNKEYFYYCEEVKAIHEDLDNPDKIERKTFELLSRTGIFQEFLRKNSFLATLFRSPGSTGGSASVPTPLPGLQTTTQVSQIIQQQLGNAGPNAMQQLQQNVQQAQTLAQELKDKINKAGGSSDDETPNFKPNPQHIKSFFRRLEFGTSIQSQRGNNYFPATTTVALTAAYRLSDKKLIGIGMGEIIGLGTGWNHLQFSQSGLNLRNFIDWRIKMSSLWLTGGYEMNYLSAFNSIEQLKQYNAWQQSGLIGLSKKYNVGKKFKGSLQLLWDFLSYRQMPRGKSIVFRTGFNLK